MSGLKQFESWEDVATGIASLVDKKILFVTGAVKSGTTWVQMLLDAHPEIACRGEGHFFPNYTDALEKLRLYQNTRIEEINRLKQPGRPLFPTISEPMADYAVRQTVLGCFAAFGGDPAIKVVGEKTPGANTVIERLFTVFPEAHVVNVVRDGRDVAVSAWHHNIRNAREQFLAACPDFDAFLPQIARLWAENQRPVMALASGVAAPPGLRQLHYEDLLADPVREATALFRWLGVDDGASAVEGSVAATAFEKLSGGRRPGEVDDNSFFRSGTAGQWRGFFTEAQVDRFWSVAGAEMEALGYGRVEGRLPVADLF